MKPETVLQNHVLAAIGSLPGIFVMRNSQAFQREYDDAGNVARMLHGGLGKGSADLIIVLAPSGRFVALELKTAKSYGEHAERQAAWARGVRAMGGFVAEVRSVQEALAAIERARRGETS